MGPATVPVPPRTHMTSDSIERSRSKATPGSMIPFFFKNGIIEPGVAFDLLRSIESLVMCVLGGTGTVAGPIVGAALYEWLRGFLITTPALANFQLFLAGLLLLVVVLFVTAGLVGWLRNRYPVLRAYIQ